MGKRLQIMNPVILQHQAIIKRPRQTQLKRSLDILTIDAGKQHPNPRVSAWCFHIVPNVNSELFLCTHFMSTWS